MKYLRQTTLLKDRIVWSVELENSFSYNKSLLLSKVSEAILPNTKQNHIGEGSTIDEFIIKQPGVKFIINGGYNHYRKNFYDWQHNNFNVGDPVGIVKIREHFFQDLDSADINDFGFFIQNKKHDSWQIVKHESLSKNEKYILGCNPLLIFNKEAISLPIEKMKPIPHNQINPPSKLSHGLQNHPRTAVGIKNHKIIFIIVEGYDNTGGCSLLELQKIGMKLELDSFLNLDGGGSSQFRIKENNTWISNNVDKEDKNRILGNVIVLFEN